MDYNYIDIIIAIILAYGIIKGFINGFIIEIASLAAIVLGVWGSIKFSYKVGEYLSKHLTWDAQYISLSAFIITFVAIVIAVSFIGKALTSLSSLIALGWLNRILGSIFGFAKSIFILSILLLIFTQFNDSIEIVKKQDLKNSILFEKIMNISPNIIPALKGFEVDKLWDQGYETIKEKLS